MQRRFFQPRTDPYSLEIQQQLKMVCEKLQIRIFSYKDITIFEPNEVLTKGGHPFRIFTAYAKAWHQQEVPAPLPRIRNLHTHGGVVGSGW
jgi:deoxyribodipyrimidine photo-lyase